MSIARYLPSLSLYLYLGGGGSEWRRVVRKDGILLYNLQLAALEM